MYERLHFGGEWPETEIRAVAAAIFRAEARFAGSPSPTYGKTWVCIREEIDEVSTLYVASRFGYHDTLKGLSAHALAERIEEFAEEGVPYADPQ